jgi:hypothetical protein
MSNSNPCFALSFLSVINCVGMMAVNPWNIGFGILKFGMKECESKCSDKTSNQEQALAKGL